MKDSTAALTYLSALISYLLDFNFLELLIKYASSFEEFSKMRERLLRCLGVDIMSGSSSWSLTTFVARLWEFEYSVSSPAFLKCLVMCPSLGLRILLHIVGRFDRALRYLDQAAFGIQILRVQ